MTGILWAWWQFRDWFTRWQSERADWKAWADRTHPDDIQIPWDDTREPPSHRGA